MKACARIGFNPTLVRLRQFAQIRKPPSLFTFQSHAGSIEAEQVARAEGLGLLRFNPTLVRLRPA